MAERALDGGQRLVGGRHLLRAMATVAAAVGVLASGPVANAGIEAVKQVGNVNLPGETESQKVETSADLIPEIVDGLETYGGKKPLSQAEMGVLIDVLNGEEKEMAPDTYYQTVFINQSSLEAWKQNRGDSINSYLLRHEQVVSSMLKDVGAGDFEIRRLIIVEDGVQPPASHLVDYADVGIKDSDGVWYIQPNDKGEYYQPEKSGYYMSEQDIDFGMIHEWFHITIHVPDAYALDFNPRVYKWSIEDTPDDWRRHVSYNDARYRNSIMVASAFTGPVYVDACLALILRGRIADGEVHDKAKLIENYYRWPTMMPNEVSFELTDWSGKVVDPQTIESVEVYRSQRLDPNDSQYDNKVLNDKPVVLDISRPLDPKELFGIASNQEYIDVQDATLFVHVKLTSGRYMWRWLDIRDFIRPALSGQGESVTMRMKMASLGSVERDPSMYQIDYLTK